MTQFIKMYVTVLLSFKYKNDTILLKFMSQFY